MKNVTYINAGAGSGKTYTLTHELLDLVKAKKVKPEEVILTTFTTKAANEFREKAKAELYANGLFEEATALDHAMIGTVHSVCQRFIGKYWFNIGLSPSMNVMAEEDTVFYLSQSLAELPTPEELSVLHAFADEFGIKEKDGFMWKTVNNYNFWQDHLKSIIEYSTSYEIDDYARSEAESINFIRQFVTSDAKEIISDAELDAMLNEAVSYVTASNRIKKKEEYFQTFEEVKNGRDKKTVAWYRNAIKTLAAKYGPTCADVSERMADVWTSRAVYETQKEYIHLIFKLAKRWKDNFADFKREKNLLDYNDMEKYMRQLMKDRDVAKEISGDYKYLFVDEFQDSSPIQVKIFDALSELMEHSYWVGDYKQSIFGFRGSDIELIKATVDRVVNIAAGCDTRTLDTSYRSLPDIVEVVNDVFATTFADAIKDKKNICLNTHRPNKDKVDSLRYFVANPKEGLGIEHHIAKLMSEGVKPREITVLARNGYRLKDVAIKLKEMQIPCSLEEQPVVGSLTCVLVESLLQIVGSSKNTLAKATVAFLTESGYDTKAIIENKLVHDGEGKKADSYLNEVPLIAKLMSLKPRLEQQSVATLIESMVIELGLIGEVKKFDEPNFGAEALQTIINTGRLYEEHCVQMNMPATIDGFIAYLEETNPTGSGDTVNGVQLQTYHACKGLENKYVILTTLNDMPSDNGKIIGYEIYGVHFDHSEEPTAENPYPNVFIRVTPWLFSTDKKIPENIGNKILCSKEFDRVKKSAIAEANRLMYVGMTRARDVMLLHVEKPGTGASLMQWFKDIGLTSAGTTQANSDGSWDVLGVGRSFSDYTVTQEDFDKLESGDDCYDEDKDYLQLVLPKKETVEKIEHKYASPSMMKGRGKVLNHHNFDVRIPFGKNPSDVAIVGDCVHQIFAGIEEVRSSNSISVGEIIKSYGLEQVLIEPTAITGAWDNLTKWLTNKYGKAVKTYHERPFRLERDGRVVVGSMDLVWQTNDGLILIDFKTNPMAPEKLLDPTNEHYVGSYAGQLDAYTDALEAAGETVLHRYIYYPVNGLLAEIGRSENEFWEEFDSKNIGLYSDTFIFPSAHGELNKILEPKYEVLKDKLLITDKDLKEGYKSQYTFCIPGESTQGVVMNIRTNNDVELTIPSFASRADVALAYKALRAVKASNPAVVITHQDSGKEADLSEDQERETYYYRLDNMANIIERQHYMIVLQSFNNDLYLLPDYIKESMPDVDPKEWTYKTYQDYVSLQWDYEDYEYVKKAELTIDDEKYNARILTNEKGFVTMCTKVVLYNKVNRSTKIVDIEDFHEYTKDNRYIKRLDYFQFVIDKMPEKEWQELYDSLPGTISERRKVYLLRWNPSISSFTLDAYKKAVDDCKPGYGFGIDWSIYEYELAHKGDEYYMLRTGDDKSGIVFHGYFESDPYEGADWAGTSKTRHYVDCSVFDAAKADNPAHISIDELEETISDIDWRKGHSGELLTSEQAEKLEKLWESHVGMLHVSADEDELEEKASGEDDDNEDDTFDPDMGHGSHLQCIEDDIDIAIEDFDNGIDHATPIEAVKNVTVQEDEDKVTMRDLLYLQNGNSDLVGRYIIVAKDTRNEVASFFPYVVNAKPIKLVLKKIYEFTNRIEAILVGEHEPTGIELRFFDVDYAKHKNDYRIGQSFDFALSALAYHAEIVPDEEMTFTADEETVARWKTEGFETSTDEEGNEIPVEFSLDKLSYILQHSEKYPDDGEFMSPVLSRVKKVKFLNREFYRMDICLTHDDPDDFELKVPLIAHISNFTEKPSMKHSVRGYLWLQGRMVNSKNKGL